MLGDFFVLVHGNLDSLKQDFLDIFTTNYKNIFMFVFVVLTLVFSSHFEGLMRYETKLMESTHYLSIEQ